MESNWADQNAHECSETPTTSGSEPSCHSNFDKIFGEIDILIYIFKLLKFSDQISLARVNFLLSEIFRNYVWKINYATMKIIESKNGKILVLNGNNAKWLYLELQEFEEFLEIYGHDVEVLITSREALRFIRMPCNVNAIEDAESDNYIEEEQENQLYNNRNLKENSLKTWSLMKNVRHLSMAGIYMEKNNLQYVTQQLPQLEGLELKLDVEKCEGFEDAYSCGQSLLQMRNLKSFALTVNSNIMLTIAYRIYREMIDALKLEYLKLEMSLQHQKKYIAPTREEQTEAVTGNTLKHLDIVITSDEHNHSTVILASCFLNCENLQQLNLQLHDLTLNEDTLHILNKKCKNIEILHLKKTNISCRKIKLPEKLKELKLIECLGLSYDNLRQILQLKNMKKFISVKTQYTGQHVDVIVSDSLEYLKCDTANTRRLLKGFKMPNLKELTWYDPFNMTTNLEGLSACTNLESLYVACDPIPLDNLMKLTQLCVLSFHHIYALDWSYVEGLLKQLSLQELQISQFYGAEVSDIPIMGFQTGIKVLRINMNMIVQADFWLDLFGQNKKLTLIFFGRIGPFHLKRIFNKSKFPKDLKTIEFSGISINCTELRNDFNGTISKTPFLKDYKSENYIKLCRL